jgi:hypothetical protein
VAEYEIRIDLGHVDFGSLHSEADFRREATRLLPGALIQIGEASGGHAWDELQKGFRRIPGFKGNSSSSDRQKFIRESGEKYRHTAGDDTKRKVVDHIVAQMKQRTQGQPMPITYNDKEVTALRFLKQEYLTNGGRPQHLHDTGGTTKALVVQHCGLNEMEYREIAGRFDHFGFIQRCAKESPHERLNINDSILEAVRSLDDKYAPQAATVHNTLNVGTMSNSAIQQGSIGASQGVTISTQEWANADKILVAISSLIGQLILSPAEATDLNAEIETIKSQLKKSEPKRSIISECFKSVKSSLESVAGKALAAGAATATPEVVHQVNAMITAWLN